MQREQLHPTIEIAGFGRRLVALFIDVIILVAINWVINTVWALASGEGFKAEVPTEALIETAGPSWPLGALVAFLVFVAYIVLFWRWKGRTPGKMIMRLKIIRSDGSDLHWSDVILRFLSYIISFLIFLIGFIWAFFDDYNQALHDKLANTYVIRVPRK